MHANGLGGPESKEQARLLYEKSANQGHPCATYNLGLMHYHGEGVPMSWEQARAWYEKAAELGNPDSQFNLALS